MNEGRFLNFLDAMDAVVSRPLTEPELLNASARSLKALIAHDDWLPDAFAQANPNSYQSYVLYIDPCSRYSVISFVWEPGQGTPIHNHTVWGLVGVLRGAERCEEYWPSSTAPGAAMVKGGEHTVQRGEIDRVSPTIGDWHRVSNARRDAPAVSIHVYGADIGRVTRSYWDERAKSVVPMVSGYANEQPWITTR